MKRPYLPGTHQYAFEMTVGIDSALAFSPGDLSTLFVDGLFALDEEGKLFPGVTVPEDRLQLCGMEPLGYRRATIWDPSRETPALGEIPMAIRELLDRLEVAKESLDAIIVRQRMLLAKLRPLVDKCHQPDALTHEDRGLAEALVAAVEAVVAAAELATRPVL